MPEAAERQDEVAVVEGDPIVEFNTRFYIIAQECRNSVDLVTKDGFREAKKALVSAVGKQRAEEHMSGLFQDFFDVRARAGESGESEEKTVSTPELSAEELADPFVRLHKVFDSVVASRGSVSEIALDRRFVEAKRLLIQTVGLQKADWYISGLFAGLTLNESVSITAFQPLN